MTEPLTSIPELVMLPVVVSVEAVSEVDITLIFLNDTDIDVGHTKLGDGCQ